VVGGQDCSGVKQEDCGDSGHSDPDHDHDRDPDPDHDPDHDPDPDPDKSNPVLNIA
jgi:hypothetical protein